MFVKILLLTVILSSETTVESPIIPDKWTVTCDDHIVSSSCVDSDCEIFCANGGKVCICKSFVNQLIFTASMWPVVEVRAPVLVQRGELSQSTVETLSSSPSVSHGAMSPTQVFRPSSSPASHSVTSPLLQSTRTRRSVSPVYHHATLTVHHHHHHHLLSWLLVTTFLHVSHSVESISTSIRMCFLHVSHFVEFKGLTESDK